MIPMNEFETHLGCTIYVNRHWQWDGEETGPTEDVVMNLRMRQPGDGRDVEVLLNPEERKKLAAILTNEVWDD